MITDLKENPYHQHDFFWSITKAADFWAQMGFNYSVPVVRWMCKCGKSMQPKSWINL